MEHFIALIRDGNVGQVGLVLQHWPQMATQVGPHGLTPLEVACENTTPQQPQKLVLLLNHGANVHVTGLIARITDWTNVSDGEETDPDQAIPLTTSQCLSISLLWHAGARFYPAPGHSTPLHDALVRGDNRLLRQVLGEVTSLPEHIQNEYWMTTDDDGATVIHVAVAARPRLVGYLLNLIPARTRTNLVSMRTFSLNSSPLDIAWQATQRDENYPIYVIHLLMAAATAPSLEQSNANLVSAGAAGG